MPEVARQHAADAHVRDSIQNAEQLARLVVADDARERRGKWLLLGQLAEIGRILHKLRDRHIEHRRFEPQELRCDL